VKFGLEIVIADTIRAGAPKFGFKPDPKFAMDRRKGREVTVFCPDGYVPTREALVRAAQYFFPEQIAAIERAPSAGTETKPNNFADAVARAFSRSQVLNTLQREFRKIVNQTEHRLRNLLLQGKLNAYYFDAYGCHSVPRALWATAHADGAIVGCGTDN
jgi:hypothetical protein